MNPKAALGAILLAGALFTAGTASAVVIAPPPANLTAWAALPGGQFSDTGVDNDTTWTLLGFGGAVTGGTALSVTENAIAGIDVYSIAFNFASNAGGQIGPSQTGFIDYSVLITIPAEFWQTVALDSSCPLPTNGCTVTKQITGVLSPTLVSTGGAPSGISPIAGQLITIHETFVTNANGILTGTQNTFTLVNNLVPEPLTLALLGIGLAGVGFTRRRSGA